MSVWTNPIVAGFGVACFAVLVLTLATLRHHNDRSTIWLGGMLLALWFVSKLTIITMGYWPSVRVGPVVNVLAVVACMVSWYQQHRWWRLILALLMEVKALVHAEFWTAVDPAYSHAYAYILTLNVIFGLELACVAMPGAGVVAGMVGRWLSDRRRGHNHGFRPVGSI